MGKVTALDMDVVTEKSGHVATPLAVSVCTTPGSPPVPVPYPVCGNTREGIAGAAIRTKINGAPLATVGSCLKTCHGNEPGTMKEIVSQSTAGPVVVMMGAPVVICELGMMGTTGSPAMMNRGPGSTARTAPSPAMTGTPGMCPGIFAAGGGGDDGGGSGDAADDSAGGGGKGGKGDGKSAPGGKPESCRAGEPVDVVTGRAFTLPAIDLELPGPLPFALTRTYSSEMAARDVGLGHGWACSWAWEIEVRRHALIVWNDEGIAVDFPAIAIGAEAMGPWGWLLRRTFEGFVLDADDGLERVFERFDDDKKRSRLVAIRDRNGNAITFTLMRDALIEVTDGAGRTLRIEPTKGGRIGSIQAYVRGRWITLAAYAYDAAGDLIAATDAEGHTIRYVYDDRHRLVSHTDRMGLTFRFRYDSKDRCVETWGELPSGDRSLVADAPAVLADGSKAKGIYHVKLEYGLERTTDVIDSTEVRSYFGNHHGLLDKRVEGPAVVTAAYDGSGHLLLRVDATGGVTRYARGRVVRETDPLGRVTAIERDADGLAIRIVDPAGGATEIQRDVHGNAIHVAEPTRAATSYERDARGLVTTIVSPTGARTMFTYDAQGNAIARTEPNGAAWRWTHDDLGRCTSEVDPLGHVTRYAWTVRGDLAAIHDASGGVTRYAYDAERRLVEEIDALGRAWRFTYGHLHRLVERHDPTGAVTLFRYNREGEIIEVERPGGDVHRFERDGNARGVGERTFDGRRIRYRLDAAGRQVRRQCGPEEIELEYDRGGQLVERRHGDEIERFDYDARGAMIRAAWSGGELRFDRDAVGRVVKETQSLGGASHAVVSGFDADGERIHRATSPGHKERIERDAMGRRTRTVLDGTHELRHERDVLGREVKRMLPGGGAIHEAHNTLGLLSRRWVTAPGSLRPMRPEAREWSAEEQPSLHEVDRAWTYTAAGEPRFARDRRRGRILYEHDEAGRLAAVIHEAQGSAETFRWDQAGEMHEAGGPQREYASGGRLLARGDASYAWDEAGRLVEKRAGANVWRYRWDEAGRLMAVQLPSGEREEYAYDPLGRRLEAKRYGVSSSARETRLVERTRFVWDQDVIAHAICTGARDGGDPVVEVKTFCFDDGTFAPAAQRDDGPDGYGGRRKTWSFYVNDPAGTPEELLDANGRVTARIERRAWGATEPAPDAGVSTPLRFQGQWADERTGLFYNRFRYYDPETGGYVSADPIGLDGGLQPFGYVPDPFGWIDLFGLHGNPYDIGPHKKQPSPRPTGLESHHLVQGAWGRQNIPGYDYGQARTMLLPAPQHDLVTKGQEGRAKARTCAGHGRYSGSARDELNGIADDYDKAGIPEKHKRRAVKSAYKGLFP